MVDWLSTTPAEIGAYIRQQAELRGIDPDIAWRVANSEGLNHPVGDYGQSFGPYQLYVGGGLGNVFQTQTGLSPANYEQNWRTQVQWVLNWVTTHGWNPGGVLTGPGSASGGGFHGATVAGISNWQGLLGSFSVPLTEGGGNGGGEPTTPPPSVNGNGTAPTTNGKQEPAPTSSLDLNFGDSLQHVFAQFGFLVIGAVLLIGGIYLIGRQR
jgi:hypothetical protein